MTRFEPGSALARAAGSQGGKARRRKLTIVQVQRQLGALATPVDVQRWLRVGIEWAAAGLIPGTTANAIASMVREWIKAYDTERVERRLRELEAQLRERDEARQSHG